jgi:hypothetical protein
MSGDGLYVNVQQEFWHRLKKEWLPTMARFGDVFRVFLNQETAALKAGASKSSYRPLSTDFVHRRRFLNVFEKTRDRRDWSVFPLMNASDHMR